MIFFVQRAGLSWNAKKTTLSLNVNDYVSYDEIFYPHGTESVDYQALLAELEILKIDLLKKTGGKVDTGRNPEVPTIWLTTVNKPYNW